MSDDDDFNPATMDDDTIYIGTRKYVAADNIKELEAKLAKAMIALKFYADLETYEQNAEPPYQNGFCAIELDEGKIARAALAEIEGMKNNE
jgi:hypothetical protein